MPYTAQDIDDILNGRKSAGNFLGNIKRTQPAVTSGLNPSLNSGLTGGIAGGVMSIAPMTPKSPPVQNPIPTPKFYQNPFKNPLEETLGTTQNAAGQTIPKYTPPVNPDADLTPQEILKKYQAISGDNSISNRDALLKQGYNSLNNIARQQVTIPLLRPKINGTVNQDEIAQAMQLRDELARQSKPGAAALSFVNSASFGQLKNPALGNTFAPEAVAEQRAAINRAEQAQPVASGVGKFAGEALKYGATAGFVNEIPAVQALTKGKLPARLLAGRLTDIVPDVVTAKQETDNTADFVKNLTINQVTGLAFDGALEGIGTVARGIVKKLTSNQPISNTEVSQLRNAISDGIKKGDIDTDAVARSIANQEATPATAPQLSRTIPDAVPTRAASNVAPQPIPRAAEISRPVRATSAEAPTFGKNTVGAAERQPGTYSYMQNEYGVFKPGESPRAREVDVPLSTNGTDKVSKFTRTTMESKATTDNLIQRFEDGVAKGDFSYSPKTDKKALDAAVSTIEYKGYADSLKQWDDVIQGRRVGTKEDMVLGQVLYSEASHVGDSETAMKLAAELAAEGTRLGQNVQALRMMKKLTPEGKLYYAQKSAQNIMDDLKKTMGKKAPNIQIDKSLADELLRAKTPEETDKVVGKIMQNIADQVPATWLDKWNAWRYLSMLGNPKTHIRNLLGNAIFTPARKIKNIIGAGIESTVGITGRTKSILTPADSEIKKFASADFSNVKDLITEGGKLNPETLINSQKTIFKTAPLEAARKFNNAALEWEDGLFLKGAYADSMAQYIKANKYTPDFLNSGTKDAKIALESARKYAILEAQKATYRDASKVANALNRFKKTNKVTSVIGEGLMPFTKTPVNILKRGTEYSPAGLIKGLTYDLSKVKSGEKTAAEAIDSIASGLTGTGIIALGMWMASMGLVSGGRPESKKESDFGALQGEQNYAININGKSYTIDWMAPVSLPFFVGVEVFNQSKGENPDISVARLVDSMTAVSEPMVNMSMLQGINSAIKTAGYSESPVTDIGLNTLTGYLGQAVPTASGQVARAIDPLRRSAYVQSGAPLPAVQRQIQNSQAKIPFASRKLQPKVDQWGRTQENIGGSLIGRLAYNSLSPGYISKNKTTPLDQHISELYKATSDTQVLPGTAPKYFTVNKEKYNLSGDEYTKYSQLRGQISYKVASSLLNDSRYKTMDDQTKADSVKDAYEFANEIAKNQVNPNYEIKGWVAKAIDSQNQGIDPSTYIAIKNTSNLDGENGTTQAELSESLFGTDLTADQKAYIYKLENPKSKINPFEKMQELGLPQDVYARYYQALIGVKSSKRPNGKTISGSLERNRRKALIDAGATLQEANAYIKAMYDYE